jgi:hypothetical protein
MGRHLHEGLELPQIQGRSPALSIPSMRTVRKTPKEL